MFVRDPRFDKRTWVNRWAVGAGVSIEGDDERDGGKPAASYGGGKIWTTLKIRSLPFIPSRINKRAWKLDPSHVHHPILQTHYRTKKTPHVKESSWKSDWQISKKSQCPHQTKRNKLHMKIPTNWNRWDLKMKMIHRRWFFQTQRKLVWDYPFCTFRHLITVAQQ